MKHSFARAPFYIKDIDSFIISHVLYNISRAQYRPETSRSKMFSWIDKLQCHHPRSHNLKKNISIN